MAIILRKNKNLIKKIADTSFKERYIISVE